MVDVGKAGYSKRFCPDNKEIIFCHADWGITFLSLLLIARD